MVKSGSSGQQSADVPLLGPITENGWSVTKNQQQNARPMLALDMIPSPREKIAVVFSRSVRLIAQRENGSAGNPGSYSTTVSASARNGAVFVHYAAGGMPGRISSRSRSSMRGPPRSGPERACGHGQEGEICRHFPLIQGIRTRQGRQRLGTRPARYWAMLKVLSKWPTPGSCRQAASARRKPRS